MSVLVIFEHDHDNVKESTLHTIAAAQKISSDVDGLVFSAKGENVAQKASQIQGIRKILLASGDHFEHFLAEDLAPIIAEQAENYTHILAPATTFGKNIMPRAAVLKDSAMVSDIVSVESEDTFIRPIYAGNAMATVQSKDDTKFITVRSTTFDKVEATGGNASIDNINAGSASGLSGFVGQELSKSERPELTSASIVISGGRGLQSGENFKLLEDLADKLGGAIGASRAAVDAGYVPNDYQVGQTGKVVAPDLYVAVGISGAIQHLAGMKDSKVIVAINKDEDAPIFQIADYGLVGDLFDIVPELSAELDKQNIAA